MVNAFVLGGELSFVEGKVTNNLRQLGINVIGVHDWDRSRPPKSLPGDTQVLLVMKEMTNHEICNAGVAIAKKSDIPYVMVSRKLAVMKDQLQRCIPLQRLQLAEEVKKMKSTPVTSTVHRRPASGRSSAKEIQDMVKGFIVLPQELKDVVREATAFVMEEMPHVLLDKDDEKFLKAVTSNIEYPNNAVMESGLSVTEIEAKVRVLILELREERLKHWAFLAESRSVRDPERRAIVPIKERMLRAMIKDVQDRGGKVPGLHTILNAFPAVFGSTLGWVSAKKVYMEALRPKDARIVAAIRFWDSFSDAVDIVMDETPQVLLKTNKKFVEAVMSAVKPPGGDAAAFDTARWSVGSTIIEQNIQVYRKAHLARWAKHSAMARQAPERKALLVVKERLIRGVARDALNAGREPPKLHHILKRLPSLFGSGVSWPKAYRIYRAVLQPGAPTVEEPKTAPVVEAKLVATPKEKTEPPVEVSTPQEVPVEKVEKVEVKKEETPKPEAKKAKEAKYEADGTITMPGGGIVEFDSSAAQTVGDVMEKLGVSLDRFIPVIGGHPVLMKAVLLSGDELTFLPVKLLPVVKMTTNGYSKLTARMLKVLFPVGIGPDQYEAFLSAAAKVEALCQSVLAEG